MLLYSLVVLTSLTLVLGWLAHFVENKWVGLSALVSNTIFKVFCVYIIFSVVNDLQLVANYLLQVLALVMTK